MLFHFFGKGSAIALLSIGWSLNFWLRMSMRKKELSYHGLISKIFLYQNGQLHEEGSITAASTTAASTTTTTSSSISTTTTVPTVFIVIVLNHPWLALVTGVAWFSIDHRHQHTYAAYEEGYEEEEEESSPTEQDDGEE